MRLQFIKVTVYTLALLAGTSCGREVDRKFVDAAAEGNVTAMNVLLERGANVNAAENDGWTPLTVASREGHLEAVKLLMEKGANVNKLEGGGHTALFWAKRNGHQQVVALLLSRGGKDI